MQQLTKKALGSIVTRLKSGKSTLGKESKGLGINRNGPLRAALIEHLGSKGAYMALIAKSRTKNKTTKKASPKKAAKAKAPKKKSLPDDGSSSDDNNGEGEPQDLVALMSGEKEDERREELEQNGTAGADTEQLVSAI